MRRRTALAAVLVALVALSACGPGTADSAGPSPSTTLTSPSPSPTVDQRARLTAVVAAAVLKPADIGGATPSRDNPDARIIAPCLAPVTSSVASHGWSYTNAKPDVIGYDVYAFDPQRGASVLNEVRTSLTQCTTWVNSILDMKVVGEFTVTQPAGMDATLAYCQLATSNTGKDKGKSFYLCNGFVSRGNVVAQVDVVTLSAADGHTAVGKALPIAAAALVRADPPT